MTNHIKRFGKGTSHRSRKHNNVILVFCCALLLLNLSACEGNDQISVLLEGQTVSNEEISNYLNDYYFLPRAIELLEIKDVTEYPGETDNKIGLTCTTISSNYYTTQTANWELNFELFDGTWVGTDCQMGVNDCKIRELIIEDIGEIIGPEYNRDTYFEVTNLETDVENKRVTAQSIYYITFPAYYISAPWTINFSWDSQNMLWVYDHVSTYNANEKAHGMNWQIHIPDISGHYDVDKRVTFDIEQDPEETGNTNLVLIKNYMKYDSVIEQYYGGFDEKSFNFDFRNHARDDGILANFELYRTNDHGYKEYAKVHMRIEGNTLFLNSQPVASITSEFVPQESYLQGTYK